jgi:tetratricopeptide (TPR) repeat protein
MEALSAALRSSGRRRRALRFAAVGLFAAVGAASAVTALHAREATPLCQGADRRLAGLWDDPRRQSLEQAFLKTGVPYAQASFRTVREALDRYASSWSSAHTDACVATRVYGEQSEEVLDRRVACLEGQLTKLRAVVDTMAGADKAAVEKAAETASRLADPALCGAADVLNALVLPPEGKEAQARVAAARERLAELEALRSLGHRAEAIEGVRALFQEAEAIGYRPLVAEVGLAFGSALRGKASSGESRKTLEKALYAAEAGHHERVALGLWLEIATHAIWSEGRYEEAERALGHAEAYLERLEGDSERIMLLERRSSLYRAQGRIAEGTQAARDAVALAEKVFGAGSIRLAAVLMELGIMLHLSGENDASIQAFSRGIAIAEAQLGKEHPSVGVLLTNLGAVHMDRKRYPEAVEVLQRAVDIIGRSLGPGAPLSSAFSDLGDALLGMGRPAEALEIARRGLAIDEAVLGPKHPNRARALARVAEARAGVGRWEEAGPEFLQAYVLAAASEEPTLGAEVLGRAQKSLGPCGAPCAAMLRRIEERAKERGR